MDRNRDGVVTIDEFIETCQKVNFVFLFTFVFIVQSPVRSEINSFSNRMKVLWRPCSSLRTSSRSIYNPQGTYCAL